MSQRWVVVSQDLSGLGWCKRLQEEGCAVTLLKGMGPDEKQPDRFAQVGQGLVPIQNLSTGTVDALCGPDVFWLFDRNYFADVADDLRSRGQMVFGTSALTARLEQDRGYACDVATQCGLPSPPTHDMETIDEGVDFLEANPNLAFVMKPNDSEFNFTTFVPFREDPVDANHELLCYLRNCPEMPKGYILQERKPGVEVNVELWYQDGEPFFAFCCLENKRRWNHNLGEMSGCAGDVVFTVPLDSPLVQTTVGKMTPFYAQQGYTGMADVNVILGDNEIWFLEVCDRFGYNSHPNLFLGLATDAMSNILGDWMQQSKEFETIPQRFRGGFSASITCFLDHPRPGLPIYVNPRVVSNFYPYDGKKVGEDVLLTGYSQEVGVYVNHDYTLEDAAEGALTKLLYGEGVTYPDIAFRTDIHKRDYSGAPAKRYEALRAMRLI